MKNRANCANPVTTPFEESIMQPSYLYKATVVRVIDGDSVVFDVDCGFDITLKNQNCRLYAIDAAETRGGTPSGS